MVIAVIGMQWGDEGKGKFVDYLSKDVDWVIRYAGGANAGHTIVHDGQKYSFHLLPTGILRPHVKVLLGPTMVIDPEQLWKELQLLEEHGIEWKNRMFVSDRAHLVLPSYKLEDSLFEQNRKIEIGTTKKGVGIAYAKRSLRTGIRIAEIDNLDESEISDASDVEFLKKYSEFLTEVRLNHFVCLDNIEKDEKILYEGAQGVMLDLDIGAYPFVTSGPTALNGVYSCGTPVGNIDEVLGVVKIYSSRVGEGPLLTEFTEDEADVLDLVRTKGHEVGTTTGRLRRCGHLDLVALRFASKIAGITSLAVTHVDVLDTFSTIKICIAYELDGNHLEYVPSSLAELKRITPVYKTLTGWNTQTSNITHWNDLPDATISFFKFIEDFIQVPLGLVSVGAEREQTIVRENYFQEWFSH